MSELQSKVKGFLVQGFRAPNVGGVPRALADARELFEAAGLGFPAVPRHLSPTLLVDSPTRDSGKRRSRLINFLQNRGAGPRMSHPLR